MLSCVSVSGSSFSCLCCKQGLCSCALNSTAGIPSLRQPPVTHCTGACLGRRKGREGKVHRDFKKLLSLPLNTLFDTPQHRPSGGALCKPHRPLLQPPAPAWLSPGMQGPTQGAFRYHVAVGNRGSAFEWKTQVSLKEWGIWLVANSSCVALLFTSPCPPFSSRLSPEESQVLAFSKGFTLLSSAVFCHQVHPPSATIPERRSSTRRREKSVVKDSL